MKGGIYLITCAANNRRYVGSARDINYRWRKHREQLESGRHANRHMRRCWNKYGADSFEWAILEIVEDEEKLVEREQFWIDTLHPEFNVSPYAGRPTSEGLERTPEWKDKVAESNRKYWDSLTEEERKERGRKAQHPHTEETKRVLAERTRKAFEEGRIPRKRLRPLTPEQKANIQAGMAEHHEELREKRRIKRAEFEAGMPERDAIRRAKISAAKTGVPLPEETKAKLREATIAQFEDNEKREKHQQAVKEAMQRPEVKEALANRPPQVRTAEANAKSAAKHRGRKNTPETIERMAQKRREYWARKKAEQAERDTGENTGI